MNETVQRIIHKRSCKGYKADAVQQEMIEEIVDAGLYANCGKGMQAPIVIAVTEKETRDALSKLNASILGADIDPFYGAPAVLVVLADKSVPTYLYDGSCTMQNMLLAADALGLGSCWIHRAKEMFESEEGKALLHKLGITGDYEGIGNCVVGYAAAPAKEAAPRKDGRAHYVK